jgi:hypothetical protein
VFWRMRLKLLFTPRHCLPLSQVLAALAQLGMRTAASLEALIGIAQQLEAAGAHIASDPAAAEAAGAVANVQRRAAALLDHLDRAAQHEGLQWPVNQLQAP